MREIKFRAWDKTENKMMGWEELCDEDKNGSGDGEHLVDYFNAVFSNVEPLMQYTGLKDKNGKEIYEGDVLMSEADEGIAVVSYNADMARFEIEIFAYDIFTGENSEEVESDTLSVVDSYEFRDWNGAEVIGNIYENPDLLKGKHE